MPKILVFFVLVLAFAGAFSFASPAEATTNYCANGSTMTGQEVANAVSAGVLSFTWTDNSGQMTVHVNNTTSCSAPLTLASYKMFQEPGTSGWLSSQQFYAESPLTNATPNSITNISVSTPSCRVQVDLWYQTAPHQLLDSDPYHNPNALPYVISATNTLTPLCVACTSHTSQKCVGNSVYWFDSCNNQQELSQACSANQTCSNGTCQTNQCVPLTCNSYNNVALNKSATATAGNTLGYEPSKAVDGNPLTSWNTNPYVADASSATLTIDLQQEYSTSGYSLRCEGAFGGNSGTIYFYNAANQVVQTKNYFGCDYGNLIQGNFSSTTNVKKVVISAYSAGDNVSVSEFALYGDQPACGNHSDGCGGQLSCGACVTPTVSCSSNSECGTSGYINSPYCQGGNVYQDYKTYTCNNPGTPQSTCSNSTAAQLKTTCSANQTCSNGSCSNQNITCSSNSDCGTNAYTGATYCQGNSVYQNYITYTCNSPGTSSSYCSNSTASQSKNDCSSNQTCSNGSCNNSCTNHSYQQCSGNYLYWYDSCGTQQDSQYCQNGCQNNSCQIQNNSCQNNSCQTYGNLTINKTVKNLASGNTSFSNSTYANPLDTLMFMITLQASGNQGVQNVFVRDVFPSNLIYQNQLVISGSSYSNNSGNIISGINLGTVTPGQTVTITYQAQVAASQNFSYGTTTLNNSVSATSSNAGNTPTASASVIVNRAAVYGASIISTGLTNNFLVDSFFLPLMITLIAIWMLRSGMFVGAEKWFYNKRKNSRNFRGERELAERIVKIKEAEGI